MTDLHYTHARLPRLYPDLDEVPVSVSEFMSLLIDRVQFAWCQRIFEWLNIANLEARAMQLSPPYPHLDDFPSGHSASAENWRDYYRGLMHGGVPEPIRAWAREDAQIISHRARSRGGDSILHAAPPRNEALTLLAAADSPAAALEIDRQLLAYSFSRLDQHLLGEAPASVAWSYAYAIQLLLLLRIGLTQE